MTFSTALKGGLIFVLIRHFPYDSGCAAKDRIEFILQSRRISAMAEYVWKFKRKKKN
jgi:hypothetical protein